MMEDDVRCSLCFNVFFHPVTTSCGHTYCKECLERSFVYSSQCPLCRAPIYPNPTLMSITEQIDVMVKNNFPGKYAERLVEYEKYLQDQKGKVHLLLANQFIPYPGQTYQLHIHELRYRLMMYRVTQESEAEFCIIPYSTSKTGAPKMHKYGCMVRILGSQLNHNGTYELEVEGTRRVHLKQKVLIESYWMGEIEEVKDVFPKSEDEYYCGRICWKGILDNLKLLKTKEKIVAPSSFSVDDINTWAPFMYYLCRCLCVNFFWKMRLIKTNSVHDRLQVLLHLMTEINS